MKKIYSKIPAMIGMLITIIGAGLLIGSFIISNNEVEPESGVSRSFALAILALITALCSLIFYLIDAVLSVIKVFKNINPVFNGVLALVIVVTIPVIFARNNLPDIRIAICAVTIFVFEIIYCSKDILFLFESISYKISFSTIYFVFSAATVIDFNNTQFENEELIETTDAGMEI